MNKLVCVKLLTGTNISLSMIININILNTAVLSKILMKMKKKKKRRAYKLFDDFVEGNSKILI